MIKLVGVLVVLSILPIALISGCVQEPAGAVCGNDVVEAGEECESDSDCSNLKTCSSCKCEALQPPALPSG